MRKMFLIVVVTLLAVAGFSIFRKTLSRETTPLQGITSTSPSISSPPNTLDYQLNGGRFRAAWFRAEPPNLKLIPNYSEKHTAAEVKDREHCQNLTSAGFYAKDGTPLGLVVTDGEKVHDYVPNALFNGVFSVTKEGRINISTKTMDHPHLAVQAGPLLFFDGEAMRLAIRADGSARRIVMGTTTQKKLIFIAFYNADNPYQGPLLGELPEHIKEFQAKSGITITAALNLDGGAASVFANKGLFLEELTPVGSFFCNQ